MKKTGSARNTYTVGYDDGVTERWARLRAYTEPEIAVLYPELLIRHGGDDDWLKRVEGEGRLERVVYDIDEPPVGLLARIVADRECHTP